jgi:two-component system, NtrC family, sensor kinase
MPSLRSSVLIVLHPSPKNIEFGADFAPDFAAARKSVADFSYPVIVLPISLEFETEALSLLEFASQTSPLAQRVVIQNDARPEALQKVINAGSVFRVLPAFEDSRFELTIKEALEEYRLLQQNVNLLQMVNDRHERLTKLTKDLEDRVEARRRSLEEAKQKVLVTNHRVEALHRALVAIHQAGSIAEMERLINDALRAALGLSWTRVVFHSQGRLEDTTSLNANVVSLHSVPLMRGGDRFRETLGYIYFARGADRPFSRDETSFLVQIADAVALAIDRLGKLEESENLKRQWEATFDAIVDPVSLVADDFTLVRINRSFADRSSAEPEKIIGRKCYEALFGRNQPCDGCRLNDSSTAVNNKAKKVGSSFRLKPTRTVGSASGQDPLVIFDVFTQSLRFEREERTLHVNMYHDMSAQLRLERQIVDSAKMAELGTIGSSIAHELNNPLGGMLSFLQLIKMDMGDSKDLPAWKPDIDEMETAARRCRDIVQSLLGFTRKSSQDSNETIDLHEVVDQALKITELQTRSMGIAVHRDLPEQAAFARGQFNALTQAVLNFLQNAQDAITERRKRDKFAGEIWISLKVSDEWNTIEIRDNGIGFDSKASGMTEDIENQSDESFYQFALYASKDPSSSVGLGLNVAHEIVRDHQGRVEISSSKVAGTSAKISLPRAENAANSSSF